LSGGDIFINFFKEVYKPHKLSGQLAWFFDVLVGIIFSQLFLQYLSISDETFTPSLFVDSFILKILFLLISSLIINSPFLLLYEKSLGDLIFSEEKRITKDPGKKVYSFGHFVTRFFSGANHFNDRLFSRENSFTHHLSWVHYCLLALLFLISLYSLDLSHLRSSHPVKFNESASITSYKTNQLDEDKKKIHSQYYRFTNELGLDFSRQWLMFPHIENIKKKEKITVHTDIRFISKFEDNKTVVFKKEYQVDWNKVLGKETLFSDSFLSEIKSSKNQFSLSAREEFSDDIKKSMNAGSEIFSVARSLGRSLKFAKLRDNLIHTLPLVKVESYFIDLAGDRTFIFFRGKDYHQEKIVFFPLGEKRPFFYSLTWGAELSDNDIKHLMSTFLRHLKWSFSRLSSHQDLALAFGQDFDDEFLILDYLKKEKMTSRVKAMGEDSLLRLVENHLFFLKKKNFSYSLSMLKNDLIKLNQFVKLKKSKFTPSFMGHWNNLITNHFKEKGLP